MSEGATAPGGEQRRYKGVYFDPSTRRWKVLRVDSRPRAPEGAEWTSHGLREPAAPALDEWPRLLSLASVVDGARSESPCAAEGSVGGMKHS